MTHALNVFNFCDYKAFLRAYAQEAKRHSRVWSFGQWAQKMNLSSTSAITMIVNGSRHPSQDVAQKLCVFFRFSEKEKTFFLDLVRLKKVKNDPELSYLILKNLTRTHPLKKFTTLNAETFEAISNWEHYAIREMLTLPDFQESPDWIKERLAFPVGKKQIEKALSDLMNNGLVARDENKKLRSTQAQITTEDDVVQEAIVRFHEQTLDLAKVAIRQNRVNEREYGAVTLNVRKHDLEKIKNFIRNVQSEFLNAFEAVDGDETYELAVQFFPLTKKSEKGEGR